MTGDYSKVVFCFLTFISLSLMGRSGYETIIGLEARRFCCGLHPTGCGLKKLRNPPSDWLPTKKGIRLQKELNGQGQKVAEQMMQIMLVGLAVTAFGSGYIMGSIEMMILVYAAGVVLTTLVTLPNWPPFNRRPLKWLDPSEAEKHPKPQQSVKK